MLNKTHNLNPVSKKKNPQSQNNESKKVKITYKNQESQNVTKKW